MPVFVAEQDSPEQAEEIVSNCDQCPEGRQAAVTLGHGRESPPVYVTLLQSPVWWEHVSLVGNARLGRVEKRQPEPRPDVRGLWLKAGKCTDGSPRCKPLWLLCGQSHHRTRCEGAVLMLACQPGHMLIASQGQRLPRVLGPAGQTLFRMGNLAESTRPILAVAAALCLRHLVTSQGHGGRCGPNSWFPLPVCPVSAALLVPTDAHTHPACSKRQHEILISASNQLGVV